MSVCHRTTVNQMTFKTNHYSHVRAWLKKMQLSERYSQVRGRWPLPGILLLRAKLWKSFRNWTVPAGLCVDFCLGRWSWSWDFLLKYLYWIVFIPQEFIRWSDWKQEVIRSQSCSLCELFVCVRLNVIVYLLIVFAIGACKIYFVNKLRFLKHIFLLWFTKQHSLERLLFLRYWTWVFPNGRQLAD